MTASHDNCDTCAICLNDQHALETNPCYYGFPYEGK